MSETGMVLREVYAAFNRRDVDGVFRWMRDEVRWPKASEGGEVVGKEEIRAYWTRQWSQFDPRVEPIEIVDGADGKTVVRVHQVVRSLRGEVLSDSEVRHVYTLADGLIERMELEGGGGTPSAAFGRH